MVVPWRCFAFRALITQPRIWKSFQVQNSTSLLYLLIPSSAETWKIVTKKVSIFFRLSWHFKREKSVFWKASFCKTRTDYAFMQDFVDKTLRLVRISLLISAIQRVLRFFSGSYFKKAIENFFLCLHSLIQTLEALGEFSTVIQTIDFVSGLHNCLKFSQPLSCLYQAMQTRKPFSIA